MNRLEYNGKYGTVEDLKSVPLGGDKFLAKPAVGKAAFFKTVRLAVEYLRKVALQLPPR